MKRLAAGLALAALAGAPCSMCTRSSGTLLAQGQPVPHAFISVLDTKGAPASDLDASQVSMLLDGTECTPLKLEPIDWPMKLSVLVDNGEESADLLPTLRDGLRRFLFEIPDGVETSLLTLAPQPRWIVRPTVERPDFWRGLDLLSHSGSAKLLEGLAEAADRIDKDKGNYFFTIVVIVTNSSESSGGDLQRMFNRLREQILKRPVTVHVVMLSTSEQKTTQTASGSPVPGAIGSTSDDVGIAAGGSVVSREGLALKNTGALQTQVSAALTKDTGGRYDNLAVASSLLTLLPEYGRQIARSAFLQSHQYRVSCEQSTSKAPQMSVFTSYPGARSLALTRDGRIP